MPGPNCLSHPRSLKPLNTSEILQPARNNTMASGTSLSICSLGLQSRYLGHRSQIYDCIPSLGRWATQQKKTTHKFLKMQSSFKNSRPGMKVPNLSSLPVWHKTKENTPAEGSMLERWSYFMIDEKLSNDIGQLQILYLLELTPFSLLSIFQDIQSHNLHALLH